MEWNKRFFGDGYEDEDFFIVEVRDLSICVPTEHINITSLLFKSLVFCFLSVEGGGFLVLLNPDCICLLSYLINGIVFVGKY